uniref:Uncharacterized protein n=1 Tax=Echinococcus granulosus TaxID=6210 RepID=A0A068WUC3_ECHGR|nr:hypothetical protein EgrG_002025600 [Echinococcus granulosus]
MLWTPLKGLDVQLTSPDGLLGKIPRPGWASGLQVERSWKLISSAHHMPQSRGYFCSVRSSKCTFFGLCPSGLDNGNTDSYYMASHRCCIDEFVSTSLENLGIGLLCTAIRSQCSPFII